MKIQLERKLASCPDKLFCTVCNETFNAGKIRALLYSDRGWLHGDLCVECLKLKPIEIRGSMRDRASSLLQQPYRLDHGLSAHDLALELLESAQEDVRFPTFYQWWLKKLEIFSEEAQEIEANRMGLDTGYGEERSRLQKMVEDDRE